MSLSVIEFLKKRGYPKTWEEPFEKAITQIEHASKMLEKLGEYFPLQENLFRAFDLCPMNKLKCVIIGQDPYHTIGSDRKPQANGLCFSSYGRIQPSLNNIFMEIKREYGEAFKMPQNGDLSGWAVQGVLLLNACLTVTPGNPGSHGMIWSGFITKIIKEIAEVHPYCIYLLWGADAGKLSLIIPESSIKLRASHPSPWSCDRGGWNSPAFTGCGHFKQVNEYLKSKGKEEIDWLHPGGYHP